MPFVLKEWSVSERPASPYMAPELRTRGLAGAVYGHPSFPDGSRVITSSVVKTEGRHVWTKSGSEYVVEGPPDEGYVRYLAENKLPLLDLDNPFGKPVQK